ncbi:MAG TPA: hypothetical protein VF100_03295, partial [Thermoanaerobaculia bacterium]
MARPAPCDAASVSRPAPRRPPPHRVPPRPPLATPPAAALAASRATALAAALALPLATSLAVACAGAPDPVVAPVREASPPAATEHRLADRVVAVLDEEAILLSDVDQVIGLGLVEQQPGESLDDLRGRVL